MFINNLFDLHDINTLKERTKYWEVHQKEEESKITHTLININKHQQSIVEKELITTYAIPLVIEKEDHTFSRLKSSIDSILF